MARGPSPLLGYNTNIRHEGKLYHIQTEDSGVGHPHIITHLFADGGRIVATSKTDYSQHLGAENLEDIVRGLMREQHKAMAVALRDRLSELEQPPADAVPDAAPAVAARPGPHTMDEDTLERAARARMASSPLWKSVPRPSGPASRPAGQDAPQPGAAGAETGGAAADKPGSSTEQPPERQQGEKPSKMKSIFGNDEVEEMTLDEVILAYIHEDTEKK